MKIPILTGLITVSIFLAGCGKGNSESGSATPTNAPTDTASADNAMDASPMPARPAASVSGPVTQPILTAWQEGDKAKAIKLFADSDWGARPIFAAGMALSLSEGQLKALPVADQELKSKELNAQRDLIKQLGDAVAQAGRDDAARGETDQARRVFISLKQFGAAIDSPDCLGAVQVVGKVSKNIANSELAKIK